MKETNANNELFPILQKYRVQHEPNCRCEACRAAERHFAGVPGQEPQVTPHFQTPTQ